MTTLSDEIPGDVTLYASFNPDGNEFLGLLAGTDGALMVRADGNWHTITEDNHYFDGSNIVEVDPDFLDFFDKLESKGTEPSYKQALSYAAPESDVEEE